MKKRIKKYILKEKVIESIGRYKIFKVKTRDRLSRYIARGLLDDGWTWSTPMYETTDECREAIAERLYYDNLPKSNVPTPSVLEVSSDMFQIESDLEPGVCYGSEY